MWKISMKPTFKCEMLCASRVAIHLEGGLFKAELTVGQISTRIADIGDPLKFRLKKGRQWVTEATL